MPEKNKTELSIERLDKYLSFMRFKYSSEEKLIRINLLNDYYATRESLATEEVCTSGIDIAEQLSGDLTLPIKVRGVFLYEGRPARKYYKAEDLELATLNPVNKSFPLMLDHKDNEASHVVGMVDKIEYDESIKGIRWWGHINDETFARNVLDGAIKEVSVTVYSESIRDDVYGIVGKDLTFKELSLVMNGAVSGNFIQPDDGTDW